ncbi:hypothetical protein EXA21_12285 [Vibrio cincinnatiensis]|uniref:hypothetical protein n=1 Tax=Vibrio cincinnatiensis TaxID=675 RepID=UPI001EDD641F|nr:hypothetical protein [Vibrio cincinnatiensis]MCG3725026.1 hypothetical protein [Vibrio cincinnatiensis]MCG3760296.1 hypothetical protein [Vibrio cincinnatiensis]MCG3763627.1 hypothetical protein [Vibrio cincinnatiensis]
MIKIESLLWRNKRGVKSFLLVMKITIKANLFYKIAAEHWLAKEIGGLLITSEYLTDRHISTAVRFSLIFLFCLPFGV